MASKLKIEKLHLTNFINISQADFSFDENMNFIYGQPASGKSAIFEAMLVSLSTYKRSSTYGEYVKQGEDNAAITLIANIFGKEAIFNTTINRVKGAVCQRRLEYDGDVFEDSQVEDWLKSRNIDYYARLTFAMQNEENIVNITSSERLAYIQKLFNFNFKSKKDKLMASKKEVEDSIINLNSQIAGNKSTIEHLSIEQQLEKRKLDDATKKAYESQIEAQTELIKANQSIIDKANKIKDEINSYGKEVLNYSDLIMQENSIIAGEAEKENEIKTLTKEIGELEDTIKTVSSELEGLKINVDDLLKQKNELVELGNAHTTTKIEIETNIKNVKNKMDLVSQGKCPTCGQPTSDLDNTLDEQLEKLNNLLEKEKTEINNLQVQLKEVDHLCTLTQTKFNTQSINLAGYNSSLKAKNTRLQILKDREPPKHACNLSEAMTKRQNLLDLQNVKQKELEQYKVTKSVSELLDEIEPLKQAINEDNIIIEKNALIIKTNSENKAKCAELTILNEKLLKEVVELNNKITTIKEAYELINKTLPKYISKTICDSLQNKINKFIHKVFPKYEVRLEVSEKGCDLLYTKDVTVVDEKRNKFLKATMSSGLERSLLNLAFKVALAESYKLDLFVGDEIDQSANDLDAKILINMLINSKYFKQLFIISHKNAVLEHITENYKGNIYQVENGNFSKTNF